MFCDFSKSLSPWTAENGCQVHLVESKTRHFCVFNCEAKRAIKRIAKKSPGSQCGCRLDAVFFPFMKIVEIENRIDLVDELMKETLELLAMY